MSEQKRRQNPVLRGFNPDPSMLRVGEDYYIATSTFEWFPGVQIHHSRDLVNWTVVAQPLDRVSQLDMLGEDNSCGVWAPCLSYSNGKFYLIYTDVKSFIGMYKDTYNYLVTAKHITGPWSEPILLNKSGFDPSLFHDEDGKKYLVNMIMDWSGIHTKFAGIALQEFSEEEGKLVGEVHNIFGGTPLGLTEGPHLYKKDGYYYLMVAEGGTGYRHAVTVARSKQLLGPYEVDPMAPMLTSFHVPYHPIQKAGHASLVDSIDGRWFLAHLCGRPVGQERRCILGRETSLQEVVWSDGWLRLKNGTNCPSLEAPALTEDAVCETAREMYEDFDGDTWSKDLQSLRAPLGELASLERKGYLRLYGADSLNSKFRQALLARRQQDFVFTAETKMEFEPHDFQQKAGLTYFYNTSCYYYLYVTKHEFMGKTIGVIKCDLGAGTALMGAGIPLGDAKEIWLRVHAAYEEARFSYSTDGEHFQEIGPVLDATILSDDYFDQTGHGMFTGAFVGICCQDLSGQGCSADFDYFCYKGLDQE